MKASEVLNIALKLLGYTENNGNVKLTQRIRNKAIVAINLVYADIWRMLGKENFKPISSTSEKIDLPADIINDVLVYGLCMNLAQSESDGDNQQFYASLYNKKRAGLGRIESYQDVLPRCYDI